jgi:acetate kinase
MPRAVLTINAGSSSIKFALFDIAAASRLSAISSGQIEGIGTAPQFLAKDAAGAVLAEQHWPQNAQQTHEVLLGHLLHWVDSHLGQESLAAVGHRIVHGGAAHYRPEPITPALLTQLAALTPLAPLHQPHNLAPVRAIAGMRPHLPQVACFDTGFHHGMSAVATRLALPREYEVEGVRRYGFHGLSYEFIARRLRDIAPRLAAGRVIAAHLGNGASLCAMQNGQSVDTTMGFTALDGLMMGTRCGSIDPGAVLYLIQQRGMPAAQVEDMLYHRSGLLGVSGIGSDMRTLLHSTERRAREAIELFVFRIAREAGALVSTLGGLDGFVFTAGIGEHAPEIRTAVCQRLAWLGVLLDSAANARPNGRISTQESRVEVWTIPTNEEAMIAHHTIETTGLAA